MWVCLLIIEDDVINKLLSMKFIKQISYVTRKRRHLISHKCTQIYLEYFYTYIIWNSSGIISYSKESAQYAATNMMSISSIGSRWKW